MNTNAAALKDAVKKLLIEEWDPIGVRNFPEAQDEYDSYVEGICRLLINRASVEDIARHLDWIEFERMGLDHNLLQARKMAERLWNVQKDQNL